MRFLVSGVAGDIGLGIGRIIKYWGIAKKVYGIDIRKNHPGEFVFDKCYKAPHAENKNYFEWITEFFKKKSNFKLIYSLNIKKPPNIHKCRP